VSRTLAQVSNALQLNYPAIPFRYLNGVLQRFFGGILDRLPCWMEEGV